MKKWAMLLLLLLLPVTAAAQLQVDIGSRVIGLGDTLEVRVQGGGEALYSYTLEKGNQTVFEGLPVPYASGVLHPRELGRYTLTVVCGGESVQAEFTVTGSEPSPEGEAAASPGGLYIDGSRSPVMQQGDVRLWRIHAPGPWTVECDADFVELSDTCGADGDTLILTVRPAFEDRTGYVVFTCGQETLTVPVRQKAVHEAEEDVSFEPVTDWITIDGERVDTCLNPEGETAFTVDASGPWQYEADGDFFTVTRTEDGIVLRTVGERDEIQKGCVHFTCGLANAYLYVYRVPEKAGAQVIRASVTPETAVAWQDTATAVAETSMDAVSLTISMPGYTKTFPAAEYARANGSSLVWEVELPLRGNGEQMLLFSAENDQGAGQKQWASLLVTQEDTLFALDEAVLISAGKYHRLKFTATAAAEKVRLVDARGQTLLDVVRQDARLQKAGSPGEEERYMAWEVDVPEGMLPAFLEMGDERIPVSVQTVLTPADISLYSQTDGWWRNKKYSISQLEQSGCAVFTLSHALQLLGYTGEEIRPETLAKTYAVALMKDGSGTMNSTLVGRAGDDFGFKTRYQLYENQSVIQDKARGGAVFSFSVVNGHIACVAQVLEEDGKCLIIDSAPSATFERKGDEPVYIRDGSGAFVPVNSPAEIPGCVYCIETDSFGCAVYYMDLAYVARRGVRLIQPR